MNKKIIVSLLLSMIIAVTVLYYDQDLYLHIYDPNWRGIISSARIQDKPNIFIVGASNVYSINSTYIMDSLMKNNQKYDVYNLADMSDMPSHRLKSLEHLISLKPKVVIYGVSITDFEKSYSRTDDKITKNDVVEKILHPKKLFTNILSYLTDYDDTEKFPRSPKEKTILFLKYIVRGPEYVHNPFINFKTVSISDQSTLESYDSQIEFRGIDTADNNKEKIALTKIINELQKNNIKVILFTAPYHKIFLNKVSNDDEVAFTSTLENISKQYDVGVYFIHRNYENLEIWRDPYHVAVNNKVVIYSDDITKIIMREIEN